MTLKDEIKKISSEIKDDVIALRRRLHQNPELSFREFETSSFIKKTLEELQIPCVSIADTGVLATIKGRGNNYSNKVIVLRADIDALPIQEKTSFPFISLNSGVMHACGHDVHTASLLGVAQILNRLRDKFSGTIKLIFQPAEEILPGGAVGVIKEGALSNPNVEAMIGQHVMPSIECGKIGVRKGKMMASMDEIKIKITGRGGHGAQPHENRDPVAAMSAVIMGLQQVVSRRSNPIIPSVLSFGLIKADGSINIIPDTVFMEGTFRTMDEGWRDEAHDTIKKIAVSIAEGLGCACDVDINRGYPSLFNNEELTGEIQSYMQEYVGVENVIEVDPWMASEDFAYYGQHVNSCFYLLGSGYENKYNPGLHTSTLNINEECLELSIGLMSFIALSNIGK